VEKTFVCSKTSIPALESKQLPILLITEALSSVVKRTGREADIVPPSTSRIDCAANPTPPGCLHGMCRTKGIFRRTFIGYRNPKLLRCNFKVADYIHAAQIPDNCLLKKD